MTQSELTDDLRRFIQTIPSIPYLEAMLLFRSAPSQLWEAETISKRLYMAKDEAARLISKLCDAHICIAVPDQPERYKYQPESENLDQLICRLARYYAQHLIEITNMIHAQSSQNKRVQQFADAFLWHQEKKNK